MNNAFDFFEQIYCINLKHRTDRWESCLSQFSLLGIADKINKREGILCAHPKLSHRQNAQIGCALSHYYILKEAQKNNYSNVLVLEDDFLFLDFGESLNNKINKSTSELPANWDLFYFGAFFVKGYDYAPVEKYSQNLIKAKTCFCTHAIAYSKNAINKILNDLNLEKELDVINFIKEYEAIDWYLARNFQENNHCFAAKDLLCVQKESYSDIERQYSDYKEKLKESYRDYVQK
jgi:GR25 family glycosyltransferase involved in LPS biosynthesis